MADEKRLCIRDQKIGVFWRTESGAFHKKFEFALHLKTFLFTLVWPGDVLL